jgi:hypothetical protein
VEKDKMHDYDNRQFQLMKSSISQFEEGRLRIDRIINILEGLLDCLQNTDEEWIDRFRNEWWILEQVYAVALYRNQDILDKEDEGFVYGAIENMKKMLEEKFS